MSIFVFGSNLAGIHGAIFGQGIGLQGNSYGVPTKDWDIHTLPLSYIKKYVDQFIEFAKTRSETTFNVTRIGCGLAGYVDEQIAPMFKDAPSNCVLPSEWKYYTN